MRLELIPIHVPKDRMERGGTGGGVGEAQGLCDPQAVITPPFGDSAIATCATQHRTARQSEERGSRMAFAARLPKVWYHREHFKQRTWRCYHQASPLARVVGQVGDAGQAQPHLEHNPLSLLGACHTTPIRKLNDPGRS